MSGLDYVVDIKHDSEREVFLPLVSIKTHGLIESYTISREFFSSQDYTTIMNLGLKLNGLIEETAYVKKGSSNQKIHSFGEAVAWLMNEGMKRHTLQRYKGLGEMNPDQLWETTMDPEVRTMLKVTIEDAIAADQLFNTLMGDAVEPRRNFIQENALSVNNLDI